MERKQFFKGPVRTPPCYYVVLAVLALLVIAPAANAQALFCNPTSKNPLKGFVEPLNGAGTLTSAHRSPYQYADDLAAPLGTLIRAMRSGTVVYVQDGYADNGGGEANFKNVNLVNIRYDDEPNCGSIRGDQKYYSLYLHMKKGSVRVRAGQKVTTGTILGEVGNSGWSTGNHLHVEVNLSTGRNWWDRVTVPYIWTSGRNK